MQFDLADYLHGATRTGTVLPACSHMITVLAATPAPGRYGQLFIRDEDLKGLDRKAARKYVGDWCQALYGQFMEQWAALNPEEEK